MLRIGPINAASPTPLTPEGCLDRKSARRLARRWLDLKLDGVLILGSIGEGSRLSDDARSSFVEIALEEAGDHLTVFASAADLSRDRMRERAARYAAMGVPCVVLCVPPEVTAATAVASVKSVADSCPVPCGYYEIPLNTGIALSLHEILDILAHQNIWAMKDSSNNSLLSQALTSRQYRPDRVALLDGVEYRAAYTRAVGYDGVLHGGGVLTARRVRTIWEKASQGLMREAMDLDRENSLFLGAVYNRFSRPLQNVAGQKYALKLLGVFDSEAVLIDQPMNDVSKQRIAAAIEQNRDWL